VCAVLTADELSLLGDLSRGRHFDMDEGEYEVSRSDQEEQQDGGTH
jgi:hypothetical protein